MSGVSVISQNPRIAMFAVQPLLDGVASKGSVVDVSEDNY